MEIEDLPILLKRLANGNFTVNVKCANDQLFKADVIGYDSEYYTVKVKFHDDNLSKTIRVPGESTGWGIEEDDMIAFKDKIVSVKIETVYFTSIIL